MVLVSIPRARSVQDGRLSDESGRETGVEVGVSEGDRVIAASVSWVQVAVFTESSVSAEDPPEADKSDGQRALREALEIALEVADELLLRLRVIGEQSWMPPSHVSPELVGTADLIDAESGKRVRNIGDDRMLILVGGSEEDALSAAGILEGMEGLAGNSPIPEAALLLHDAAETLTARSGRERPRQDTRRAVLLAAIASEVAIRDALREKTPADRRPLVDLFAKHWSDVDVAIAVIPHTFMKAAVGRSLHEDDPELFARVERLFTRRNRVAHRGEEPTLQQAREAVSAARGLARWLDDLPSPV